MSQHSVSSSQPALAWHAEAQRLLAKPFVVGQGAYREGQRISVQITPRRQADTTVDLSVAIAPRLLPPSTPTTMSADKGARAAFLKGLRDPDYHIRIAACEALGQLGHTEARAALQRATQDEHHAVRAAATWALTALDTTRVLEEELTGLALVLVQQSQHLDSPLAREITDRRGRVRFPHVPADAVCRVYLLSKPRGTEVTPPSARPVWHLPAHELPSKEPRALAAKSAQDMASSLPQTHEIPLEDGTLLGTLYRDERGCVVFGMRSDAPQLLDGWAYVTAVGQQTQMEAWHVFVALRPDRDGILTGTAVLCTVLEPGQGYTISCEPIPALRGHSK